jgi:hypothetical protein
MHLLFSVLFLVKQMGTEKSREPSSLHSLTNKAKMASLDSSKTISNPKLVWRGLIDLSTMFNGSTEQYPERGRSDVVHILKTACSPLDNFLFLIKIICIRMI